MSGRNWFAVLYLAPLLGLNQFAGADVVTLRGGNQIEGLILDHKTSQQEICLLTLKGEVPIPRSQTVDVRQEGTVLERYELAQKLLKVDDVAGQFELARWCEANELAREAQDKLRHVVQLDPDHGAARRLLGFVRRNGQWVKLEDASRSSAGEAQSQSSSRGERAAADPETATDQEMQLIDDPVSDRKESLAARRARWEREISRLAKWLGSKNADQVRRARETLAELKDPMAVPALLRALGALSEDNRGRIVASMAQIAGPEAAAALALVAVSDPSADLRWTAIETIRGRDPRFSRPTLIAALKSSNRELVFNAAEAAAELGDLQLGPHLIGALTTDSEYNYETPGYTFLTQGLVDVELTGFARH